MVEIIKAGGWLMLPIILCYIVAIAIVIEHFWTLRAARIAPRYMFGQSGFSRLSIATRQPDDN